MVKPWIDSNFPNTPCIQQQDSAPQHKVRKTQRWCLVNLKDFWSAQFWHTESPDANPLDYSIWSEMQRKAWRTSHRNVEKLKPPICTEWDNLEEAFIIKVCKRFRGRVEKKVNAEGGYVT